MHDIKKHWTAVSTLLGLISSVYHDLYQWRLDLQSVITGSISTGEIMVYTADET